MSDDILLRAVQELAPLWDLPQRLVMVAMFDIARDLRVDVFERARLVVRSDASDSPVEGRLNVFGALSMLTDARESSRPAAVD